MALSQHPPADPADRSPDQTRELNAWKLRSPRAYAEIVLHIEDDYDYGGKIC